MFTVQVYAVNRASKSGPSEPLEFTLHEEIETVTILQVGRSIGYTFWLTNDTSE